MRRFFAILTIVASTLLGAFAFVLAAAGALEDFSLWVAVADWLSDHPSVLAVAVILSLTAGIAAWKTPPKTGFDWEFVPPATAEFRDVLHHSYPKKETRNNVEVRAAIDFKNTSEHLFRASLRSGALLYRQWIVFKRKASIDVEASAPPWLTSRKGGAIGTEVTVQPMALEETWLSASFVLPESFYHRLSERRLYLRLEVGGLSRSKQKTVKLQSDLRFYQSD